MLYCITSYSQSSTDSLFDKIDPGKLSAAVERKLNGIEDKIIVKSERIIQRLQRQEQKMNKKELSSKDSINARTKLAEIQTRYRALEEKLTKPSCAGFSKIWQYIPHVDTLCSVLKFLNQHFPNKNLTNAIAKIESLNDRLQVAQEIKDFISERRELLQQEFKELSLVRELKKLNKKVYYYSERLKGYKELLSDPDKIEAKAIELLNEAKVFQDFMRKNSMLASLFRLPPDQGDPGDATGLGGLQTRAQVNDLVQQQIAAGGPNARAQFQQEVQEAQSQLNQLKHRIIKSAPLGDRGSSDDMMPQGFRPDDQKTRLLLKRFEYGTNIQAQRATNFFPATTDLGLSVGYKLNDKSIIGIGASYKIGLGRGWDNIEISSQGAGLRSYVDWKLKGTIWISGGYEMNYKSQLRSIQFPSPFGVGQEVAPWQQSGLLGLTKVFEVKSKYFRKTKLQLLWDFLSYEQIPKTQAVLFRTEYGFK